jgi:hypothetical protein
MGLDSLVKIFDDGDIGRQFNSIIHRLARDCRARPGIGKARSLKMRVDFVPMTDDSGHLSKVGIRVYFPTEAMPERASNLVFGDVASRRSNPAQLTFVWDDLAGDDPKQETIGGDWREQEVDRDVPDRPSAPNISPDDLFGS